MPLNYTSIIEPTPNYDCHVAKEKEMDVLKLPPSRAFDLTQVIGVLVCFPKLCHCLSQYFVQTNQNKDSFTTKVELLLSLIKPGLILV